MSSYEDPYNYEIGRQVGNSKQLLPPGYSLHRSEGYFFVTLGKSESGIDWNKWRLYRWAWAHYRKTLTNKDQTK